VEERRKAVVVWAAGLAAGAGVVAGFFQHVRGLFFAAVVIGSMAFLLLVVAGVPDLWGWLTELARTLAERRRKPHPTFTERWRHTTEGMEVPGLTITDENTER
jgi:hypothetical protein